MAIISCAAADHPANGSRIAIDGESAASWQIDANFGFFFGTDAFPRFRGTQERLLADANVPESVKAKLKQWIAENGATDAEDEEL